MNAFVFRALQAESATMRTQEHLQAAQTTLVGLEKALAGERSAREQTSAELAKQRLVHTRSNTQREAAEALAAERQHLRDEALAERDPPRINLYNVRRQTDALTQELQREISEQRTAQEQRVEALTEAIVTAEPVSSNASPNNQRPECALLAAETRSQSATVAGARILPGWPRSSRSTFHRQPRDCGTG